MRNLVCLSLVLALGACSAEDDKPGGVSRDEAGALDAAAEMLDQRELPALPEAVASDQPALAPSPSAS